MINLSRFERNADFLLSYKRDVNNFSFSLSGGGNTRYQKNTDLRSSTKDRTGLVIPGLYTLSNIAPANLS